MEHATGSLEGAAQAGNPRAGRRHAGREGQVMSDLRFAVLGPVRAWRGDTELNLGSPQQRAVLAVLLLAEGRQVSRSALVDALWEDDPPPASVATVRTYISRLRRCLRTSTGARRDVIESAGDGYCLPLRSVALDLNVFLERTEEAQEAADAGQTEHAMELLQDALGLWQGGPLAGIPGRYAESQRVRLATLQMDALEERLALDIALGGHVRAAAELRSLLASHPMRERLSELLMLALYRSGRQADALAVFGNTRRLLIEALGIEPGPALQSMHQRILQMDESLIGPADRDGRRPAAPSPVTALVGRDYDVEQVARQLAPHDRCLVVLTGTGGLGKTRPALAVMERTRPHWRDGAAVDFSPVSEPERVPDVIASALGLVVQGQEWPLDVLQRNLAGQNMLIVLDNFEQMLEAAPLLADLAHQAPQLNLLVTSRVAL